MERRCEPSRAAMTASEREQLVHSARNAGLIAIYGANRMHFYAEQPVDPNGPPYFSSGSMIECTAFVLGWAAHRTESLLRKYLREARA